MQLINLNNWDSTEPKFLPSNPLQKSWQYAWFEVLGGDEFSYRLSCYFPLVSAWMPFTFGFVSLHVGA